VSEELLDEITAEAAPEMEVAVSVDESLARFDANDITEGRRIDVSGIGIGHRAATAVRSSIDIEARTAMIAISSEEPYERSFGIEVLEHSNEAIDLEFLSSGRAPFLLDHDPSQTIGVIESVELDSNARRLRARVRFGKSALANEIFQDYVDGIRSNISVGYSIDKMELSQKGANGKASTYTATRWRPVEASSVAIPADTSVGLGRSAETSNITVTSNEAKAMTQEINIADIESNARQSATRSAAQIVELGARHNLQDLARKALEQGTSIEEFRGEVLEVIGSKRSLENQDIGLTKKETQRFSLMRVINAMANPTDRRAQEAAKFEFECSRAAAEAFGRTPEGIMMPVEVLRTWSRALNSADEASLFSDDYRGSSFIDVLRNSSSVMRAGTTMLNGLSGDVKVPKKLTAAAAGWIATEGSDSSESEFSVGSVAMVPRQLGAHTLITRQMMQQSSMDVENLVRDDLAQALALAIDLAALEGPGTGGAPTGLLSTGSLTKVTAFAGVNPTFAELVSLETAVDNANALTGNPAYILRSNAKGALKTSEKASGTAQFIWEQGNTLNGYNAFVSNQLTDGNIYFGNWSDMLIGFWSGLDILVNPYSNSKSGSVEVSAFQTCDVAVRHIQSFAYGNDTV